jgi:hypothetical protein
MFIIATLLPAERHRCTPLGSPSLVAAFEAAFARLQVLFEETCASPEGWPLRVARTIRAGLFFAVEDPVAAELLANEVLAWGADGQRRYERLISYLASRLEPGRRECPRAEDLPDTLEAALAGGLVFLVSRRLEQERVADLPAAAPHAIEFVLIPYLGIAEAKRIARLPLEARPEAPRCR